MPMDLPVDELSMNGCASLFLVLFSLLCVRMHVRSQTAPVGEALCTKGTSKGFVSRVDSLVSGQRDLLSKALAADGAVEGFFSRVDSHVGHHV